MNSFDPSSPVVLSSPIDGISAVRFHPESNYSSFLAISSWDSSVRLFDCEQNQELLSVNQGIPCLDLVWNANNPTHLYSSGADGSIFSLDLENPEPTLIARDPSGAGIRSLKFSAEQNLLLAGSWSGNLMAIDPRQGGAPVSSIDLGGSSRKILSMGLGGQKLVVATAGRGVFLFDSRSFKRYEQFRESSLLQQTRCVAAMPSGQGYALSSVEGRVAIEYFDASAEVQAQKYAFKCHRNAADGRISSVNQIAFHPKYGSLFSGGTDGLLAVWDIESKKRICQYPKYSSPSSIASISLNFDGSMIAVANSYGWEKGELSMEMKETMKDQLFIRNIHAHEVKPKHFKE